jgi:hypothetical protein
MADLTSGTLGGLDSGVNLGQNFRKTFPSSKFGTRELEFLGVGIIPNQQTAIPFPVTFLNNEYTNLYVGTNSYITFGDSTSNYSFGTDATMDGENLPAILIAEDDNSMQWLYSSVRGNMGERELRIRFEGTTNSDPYSNAVSGDPDLVWEIVFYENKTGIMDLILLKDGHGSYSTAVSGITNGTNWVDGRDDRHGSWGLGTTTFDVSGATATVVNFTKMTEALGSDNMNVLHSFNHDSGGSNNSEDEDDSYYWVQAWVWNQSDFAYALRAIQSVTEVYFVGDPDVRIGALTFVIAVPVSNDNFSMRDNGPYTPDYVGPNHSEPLVLDLEYALYLAGYDNIVYPLTVAADGIYFQP